MLGVKIGLKGERKGGESIGKTKYGRHKNR
jgi:hypothetical protein